MDYVVSMKNMGSLFIISTRLSSIVKFHKSDKNFIKIGYGCAIYEHISKAYRKLHKNHDPSKIYFAPKIEGNYTWN